MKDGWEEIDARMRGGMGRMVRKAYVVLRPKEGLIYFSWRAQEEYLKGFKRIIVRYNRKLNRLSFVPSENGNRGYKIGHRGTIGARNLFNVLEKEMKKRRAFFLRYNVDAGWLEIDMNEKREGDMKWLKP